MNDTYLTITELSDRIKYSKQSIYNLIHKKVLIQQVHFFKPTPKKLLFKWEAIKQWIEGTPQVSDTADTTESSIKASVEAPKQEPPQSIDTENRIHI